MVHFLLAALTLTGALLLASSNAAELRWWGTGKEAFTSADVSETTGVALLTTGSASPGEKNAVVPFFLSNLTFGGAVSLASNVNSANKGLSYVLILSTARVAVVGADQWFSTLFLLNLDTLSLISVRNSACGSPYDDGQAALRGVANATTGLIYGWTWGGFTQSLRRAKVDATTGAFTCEALTALGYNYQGACMAYDPTSDAVIVSPDGGGFSVADGSVTGSAGLRYAKSFPTVPSPAAQFANGQCIAAVYPLLHFISGASTVTTVRYSMSDASLEKTISVPASFGKINGMFSNRLGNAVFVVTASGTVLQYCTDATGALSLNAQADVASLLVLVPVSAQAGEVNLSGGFYLPANNSVLLYTSTGASIIFVPCSEFNVMQGQSLQPCRCVPFPSPSPTPTATASSSGSPTASSARSPSPTATASSSSTTSSTSSSSPSSASTSSTGRSSTPTPQKWVSFFVSFRGSDPGALLSDLAYVCAIRHAFSQLAAVPVSAVRLVVARSESGSSFSVLVSQLEGSCGASRLLLAHPARRAQSLSPIRIEVSVDVSKTALTSFLSNAEKAVRAEIDAAFDQNPSLIDSLFSPATSAACSAQGIPLNLCPNPPSLALSLSSSGNTAPSQTEPGSVLVPAVAGAIGGTAFGAAVLAVLWWKAKSVSRSKLSPSPDFPGLVIRRVTIAPSAPPADAPSLDSGGLSSSKGFVVEQRPI